MDKINFIKNIIGFVFDNGPNFDGRRFFRFLNKIGQLTAVHYEKTKSLIFLGHDVKVGTTIRTQKKI